MPTSARGERAGVVEAVADHQHAAIRPPAGGGRSPACPRANCETRWARRTSGPTSTRRGAMVAGEEPQLVAGGQPRRAHRRCRAARAARESIRPIRSPDSGPGAIATGRALAGRPRDERGRADGHAHAVDQSGQAPPALDLDAGAHVTDDRPLPASARLTGCTDAAASCRTLRQALALKPAHIG